MPTFQHGKDTHIALGTKGSETSTTDVSDSVNETTLPEEVETGDTTTYGNGARTYVAGLSNATLSISGVWNPTIDAHLADLVGNDIPVAFDFGPAGNGTGAVKYSQTGGAGSPGLLLTSYEISNPVGDTVTFSAEFQVSDAITRGTFS